MSRKKQLTKKEVMDALEKTLGNKTQAGALLGRDRRTIHNYVKKHDLQEWVDGLNDTMHDKLAGRAYEEAMNGNTAMLIFLLKTRFGYRESSHIESDNKVEITIVSDDET